MRRFKTMNHIYMGKPGAVLGSGIWVEEKADSLIDLIQYRKSLMATLAMSDPTRIDGTLDTYQTYVGLTYRLLLGEWPVVKYGLEYESTDSGRIVYMAWTVHEDAPDLYNDPYSYLLN